MSLILAYKNRGLTKDLTILDGADAPITPGANDELRITIGHEGKTPVLQFVSGTPTDAGSSITKEGGENGSHRMRLDADDLSFPPGVYTLFFDYFDNADAEEWKNISRQVFCLEAT